MIGIAVCIVLLAAFIGIGWKAAFGSVRADETPAQGRIFEMVGYSVEKIEPQIGHPFYIFRFDEGVLCVATDGGTGCATTRDGVIR